MRTLILILLAGCSIVLKGQPQFRITERAPMPIPVANNAITAAEANGSIYVYSFGGIGTGLTYADIILSAFRYNVATNSWDTLPPLPDTLGRIASAASYVKGKIYIIGGHHLLPNGDVVTSNKVHVFDPATNIYLPDGAPLPIPTTDHIQIAWRDSLIYVISGWDHTNHHTAMQIYNPGTDTWTTGTTIPNTQDYKAFGATGTIIGDTIYYMGGARTGLNYPAAPELRKGVINPANPTQITWSYDIYFGTAGYHTGAATASGWAIWIGGAADSHIYNAFAYDGSGVVQPENRMVLYNPELDSLLIRTDVLPVAVMDLRGAAQLDSKSFLICGGMLENALVTHRTFLFTDTSVTGIRSIAHNLAIKVYPNPAVDVLYVESPLDGVIKLTDAVGRSVMAPKLVLANETTKLALPPALPAGFYLLQVETARGTVVERVLVR